MRKSFKLIVFISVSAILSLVLALFIAPMRGSFSEYSNRITNKIVTVAGVDLKGANNGIGAVNTARIESTIQVGSIKSGKAKVAARSNSNVESSQLSGISYSLQAYAQRNQVVGSYAGIGSTAGSGVLANSSNATSNGVQGLIGINSTKMKSNSITTGPALIGLNVLKTDLGSAGLSAGQATGPQSAGGGPPPEEGGAGHPSLPLGDGTSLLLVMAMLFGSWKMLSSKRSLKSSKI
ncbi:MAG: hypothetical protein WCJ61_04665 [Paludibacter sp.]